jgi:hypothetical protein
MTLAISGTTGITLASQFDSASTFGFKNRIINGGMVIDQRNAGASVSNVAAAGVYAIDRWKYYGTAASKFTIQQTPSATETGYATRVAAGFTNYLAFTSSASTSVASTDLYAFAQNIEGFNVSDLAWGTANAKTVTLSAWVYSSLTGTFSGSAGNSAANRCYPFSFSIPTANTWTQISVTIPGDTSGTWLTNSSTGLQFWFNLGSGSTNLGTANAWGSTFYYGTTGSQSIIATSGATFYITGVQLEKGSTATSFDFRSYGTELELCQRYYEQTGYGVGRSSSSTAMDLVWSWKVEKRASPSTSSVLFNGTNAVQQLGRSAVNITSVSSVFQVSVNNIGTAVATSDTGLTTGSVATSAGVNYIIAGSAEL